MAMDDLDDCLAAGRANAPPPPDALLARISADAAAEISRRERSRGRAPRPRLRDLVSALGGRPAAWGLAAAAVAGVAIGSAVPTSISLFGLETAAESYDLGDLAPGWSGWESAMLDGG